MTLPTWPCRPTPITIVRAHGLVIEVYPAPPRRPDLAAYGHADRRPGRLRGALAERSNATPAAEPAPVVAPVIETVGVAVEERAATPLPSVPMGFVASDRDAAVAAAGIRLAQVLRDGMRRTGPVIDRLLNEVPTDALVAASGAEFQVGEAGPELSARDQAFGGALHPHAFGQLAARVGEPDPEGEWCVYWETCGDDPHVVDRYATENAADAAATLADEALRARHSGQLLCGYGVRHLVGGEWLISEEDF